MLLSSSAMAKYIALCFCKGAVVEENVITDSGKTAPVSDTAIKEVEGEDLPYPIPRSISMATITIVDSVPFPEPGTYGDRD